MSGKEVSQNLYKIEGFSIPGSPVDVDALLHKGNIADKSIYDLPKDALRSGSKVTQLQFASFRVIFPEELSINRLLEEGADTYGFHKHLDKARSILDQSSDFQKYLNVIHKKIPIDDIDINDDAYPSTLAILRDLQELVVPRRYRLKRNWYQYEESEEKGGNKSVKRGSRLTFRGFVKPGTINEQDADVETKDEATVNAAFVVFLRSISKLAKDQRVHFVFDHVKMHANFKGAKFTAITDGALQRSASDWVLAILEAKKRDRQKRKDQIRMQEGTEAVAWFKTSAIHERYLNGHPFILSQDREKLFVTFAIYDKSYLDYLRVPKAKITPTTYLTLQTYGPCSIFDKAAVEKFATFILAITLAAQDSISA